jgi:hypothetical protein
MGGEHREENSWGGSTAKGETTAGAGGGRWSMVFVDMYPA